MTANKNIEIERKFLIIQDKLPPLQRAMHHHIEQGYLSHNPTTRVRVRGGQGFLTIKGQGKIERAEYEYEIPGEDAEAILKHCSERITKIRYEWPAADGHLWEIDCFQGSLQGLWLAEIELRSQTEVFERPVWIGEEVSLDPRYSNANLARAGLVPSLTPKIGVTAPVQDDYNIPKGQPGRTAGTIAWSEHLEAWEGYAKKYGREQSAVRMAERGGFGYGELVMFLGHEPVTWLPRRTER